MGKSQTKKRHRIHITWSNFIIFRKLNNVVFRDRNMCSIKIEKNKKENQENDKQKSKDHVPWVGRETMKGEGIHCGLQSHGHL